MANESFAGSSVGSYNPLCSHNGPHWLSIAAGSNDLAKASRPGVLALGAVVLLGLVVCVMGQ